MRNYLRLMRPHHYLKNLLVGLPLFFSVNLFNGPMLARCALGTVAFCLLSSAVYVFNDLRDAPADRAHPVKRARPLAAGTVSPAAARTLLAALLALALALNALAAGTRMLAWAALFAYFGINVGYSLGLKRVPIVDIAILVAGFLLRVLYGGAVADVPVSNWLYLTVTSLSFYLGLGKRRNELLQDGEDNRAVLRQYSAAFLDKNMYMFLPLSIAFYALWSVDPVTAAQRNAGVLVWTVPLVILICMRYSFDVERKAYGDPVDVLLHDKVLIGMLVLYAAICFATLYGGRIWG
jgi:4-hydroxybenzoate polyprenyltransferase